MSLEQICQSDLSDLSDLSDQSDQSDLIQNLNKYKKDITEQLTYGKKLKFDYINCDKLIELLDLKKIPKDNLTYLDILKYNFNLLIDQLADYFPDIKINKFINSPCILECKIKHEKFTYKYDIYLILTKKDEIYEFGLDFFSNLSDCPPNKYYHSKILLDNYEYFFEEDIKSNNDIIHYLNNTLFGLLISICALKDDEYQLAEIVFVKSNQEDRKSSKEILKELGYFSRIINWKKSNSINLEDLFDELMLEDNNTENNIDKEQFLSIINDICNNKKINFSSEQETITYEIFCKLLLNIDSRYNSHTLLQYKETYLKAIDVLIDSLRIINKTIKEINMKKKFTPDFINNLIMFHLDEYIDQKVLKNI
jgi:hypothetical protein